MAKKQEQPSRGPTRRQIALSKKEQEQLRLVYLGLGLVTLLIIIVLAIGLVQNYIIEPNTPVATVNDQEVVTGDYQDRVLYERFILEDQYQQIAQQQQSLPPASDNDDQFTELLRNQYVQFANQILQRRSIVDRQTLDTMIDESLIVAEAEKRNISATDAEVTEFVNQIVARRAGGLTVAAASETSTAVADASATAAVWTPTPTLTPSPTLTTTEVFTQPTATPFALPTPAPTPTLNVIEGETLSTAYSEWLNTLAEFADTDEAQYRNYIRIALLSNMLREAIGEEVPTTALQSQARHILVETEAEAQAVLDRLEAGEDFGTLAEELSIDPGSVTNGGDLGFVPQGRFVAPVDEAVFSLPIGQISEPIESQFGWHIVEVLAREEQELSPTEYDQSQRLAYDNWLSDTRESAEIEDFWTPDLAPEDTFFAQ